MGCYSKKLVLLVIAASFIVLKAQISNLPMPKNSPSLDPNNSRSSLPPIPARDETIASSADRSRSQPVSVDTLIVKPDGIALNSDRGPRPLDRNTDAAAGATGIEINFVDTRRQAFPLRANFSMPEDRKNSSNIVEVSSRTKNDQEIEFVSLNKPPCDSKGLGYCTEDDDYKLVEARINELMEKSPLPKLLLDYLDQPKEKAHSIHERIGPFVDDIQVCLAREEVIFPKRATNEHDEWVYVVNTETVKQGFVVETCVRPEQRCLPWNMAGSRCEQKYTLKRAIAVDRNGTRLVSESVYIPSCCICRVRPNFTDYF